MPCRHASKALSDCFFRVHTPDMVAEKVYQLSQGKSEAEINAMPFKALAKRVRRSTRPPAEMAEKLRYFSSHLGA